MSPIPSGAVSPAEYQERLNQLTSELRQEQEALSRENNELDGLLRQVQTEIDKLGQREGSIKSRVRDMEINLDNYTRQDMKTIYNNAHENEMRLFMMRGQVEQLQAKKQSIRALMNRVQRTLETLTQMPEGFAPGGSSRVHAARADSLGREVSQQDVVTKVIQAQEDERLRISRQMHDGPAQTMTNLVLRAEICERLLDIDVARARAELAGLKSMVNGTLQATRSFIFDLRPMILDDLGLEPTLRGYLRQYNEKNKMEVNLSVIGMKGRLPQPVEVAVYRIVQESLNNVAKHAHATHAQVNLEMEGEELLVTVEDDGSGFNVDDLAEQGDSGKALGIASMRQRAEMLGGQIVLESLVGRGTKVSASIPVG
ncbi:MAG TPA: ATP-binding protein [Chloroflexia bacterium]|nr:ATP-binding protein [Chloroflexia bacterium]